MTGVELRAVFLDQDAVTTAILARLLDTGETRRAAAFHFAQDRTRWIVARAALRILLGRQTSTPAAQVPILYGENGKPFLSGHPVHFNLSHSDGQALIVFSTTGPVGVDLERHSRGAELTECMDAFLHPAETHRLEATHNLAARPRALIRTWCAKEAYLKALGPGLALPPQQLIVEWKSDRLARLHPPNTPTLLIHFPDPPADYCAAVALPSGLTCPAVDQLDILPEP